MPYMQYTCRIQNIVIKLSVYNIHELLKHHDFFTVTLLEVAPEDRHNYTTYNNFHAYKLVQFSQFNSDVKGNLKIEIQSLQKV